MSRSFFNFDTLELRYQPYPIGFAKPVIDEGTYAAMVDAYPPLELFTEFTKVGKKWTLSEKFNGRQYDDYTRKTPIWREFLAWVKSDEFVALTLRSLKDRHIDLGYKINGSRPKQMMKNLREVLTGHAVHRAAQLRSRFEFSMLPADGGCVIPHTDSPGKIVTLVISMMRPGEWQEGYGGGTEVDRPKDDRKSFNFLNAQAGFDEMQELETYPFTPNQAVVFVKTFNSWHCVRPMTGPATALRKTLTLNIEA
jgi:hypothetical protein